MTRIALLSILFLTACAGVHAPCDVGDAGQVPMGDAGPPPMACASLANVYAQVADVLSCPTPRPALVCPWTTEVSEDVLVVCITEIEANVTGCADLPARIAACAQIDPMVDAGLAQ